MPEQYPDITHWVLIGVYNRLSIPFFIPTLKDTTLYPGLAIISFRRKKSRSRAE